MPESSEVDEEHYITFTEDRRPDHCASDGQPLLYPDTLDAMLQIVSNVGKAVWKSYETSKFKQRGPT